VSGQFAKIEAKVGVPLVERDTKGRPQGLTLTGGTAVLGIVALVLTALLGAVFGVRKWVGETHPGTVVLKSRNQEYSRVSTSAS
jgi:hypothetical protein